jgi:hypothetical protein
VGAASRWLREAEIKRQLQRERPRGFGEAFRLTRIDCVQDKSAGWVGAREKWRGGGTEVMGVLADARG